MHMPWKIIQFVQSYSKIMFKLVIDKYLNVNYFNSKKFTFFKKSTHSIAITRYNLQSSFEQNLDYFSLSNYLEK